MDCDSKIEDCSRPASGYLVNLGPGGYRRFRTYGEYQAYLHSELGRRLAAYYSIPKNKR